MRFYIKKFIPIYKSAHLICVGFVKNKDRYIELEYNDDNLSQVENIAKDGIDESMLTNPIYQKLFSMGFLEKTIPKKNEDVNRAELYFQYLDNQNLSNEIKNSKILVFGAGAGGATLVYLFGQMGFKNILVVDDDLVSKSDVQRLTIFDSSDIGFPKTEALANRLRRNFSTELETLNAAFIEYDDLKEIIESYKPDFIIKACDPDLIFRVNLNKICFEKKIPFFMVAYAFELLRLGPLYVPGFTSCDDAINQMVKKAYGSHYDFKSDEKLFTNHLIHPAISFNINMMASFAFKEILMFLTQQYEYCFTIGRLIEFNPLSLGYNHFEIKCDDECPICQLS